MILKIELLSDTCIGNGNGMGSLIDNDIVHDRYGLPYIPARRLKGLLKSAALEANSVFGDVFASSVIDDIFGKEGIQTGKLIIDNACLADYQKMRVEIDSVNVNKDCHLSPEAVLSCYTNVRAQTEIEDDHAKDGSLRKIRLVKKGNVFHAQLHCDGYEEELIKMAKFVRHMGVNRSRGFGNVRFTIQTARPEEVTLMTPEMNDNDVYTLQLNMHNSSELMLTGNRQNESLSYISGSSLMGFFANAWIRKYGEDDFKEAFLSKESDLHFSNAYVSDKSYELTTMAPYSLYKYKNTKTYINTLDLFENRSLEYEGVSQKSMVRNTVIATDLKNISVMPVDYSINYHLRMKDRGFDAHDDMDDGMFYQFTGIAADQIFTTQISGKEEDLKKICGLLKDCGNTIRVGKSRNSQYGSLCVDDVQSITAHQVKSKRFYLLARNHILINDDTLSNQTDKKIESLLKTIHPDLKLKEKYLQFTTVKGYNNTWKLPMPEVKAFKAGCCFVVECDHPITLNSVVWAGNRTTEGFGQILVYNLDDSECELTKGFMEQKEDQQNTTTVFGYHHIQNILLTTLDHDLKNQLANLALEKSTIHSSNATQIGRLLLMLSDVTYFTEYQKKVGLISDDKRREKALNIVNSDMSEMKRIFESVTEKYSDYCKADISIDQYQLYYIKELLTDMKIRLRTEDKGEVQA